jgi:hypothetical protein
MAKAFWNRSSQSDQTLVPDAFYTDSNLPDPGFAPLITSAPGAISSPGSSLQAAAGGLITAPDQASSSAAAVNLAASASQTVAMAGSGLVFNNTYTGNVDNLYKVIIVAAENYLQSQFTNSVTVNVTFDLASLKASDAASNSSNGVFVSYSQLLSALQSHATSADDFAAVAALDKLPDPSNGQTFKVTNGLARILGLADPLKAGDTTTPDDTLTLNSSIWNDTNFYFFPLDARAVIEHELTEGIMGRLGFLGKAPGSFDWGPMDLFRFTSTGQRDFTGSSDTPTYFSPDGNNVNTGLQYHSLDSSGNYTGDFADWDQVGDDSNAQDPFGPGGPGSFGPGTLSPTDLSILDVLGWTRADLPNVIVSRLMPATTSVPQGTNLSFSYVIENDQGSTGTGDAGLKASVQYHPAWQVDAKPTPTSFLGSDTSNALKAGATASFTDSISTAGLSFGPHTLWVAADNTNMTNNLASFTFTVTGPDLIVSSLTPASTSVNQGTSLGFTFGITNQSTLPAGASVEAWQVDAKPTPTSFLGSFILVSLAAGSTVSPPFPLSIPTAGLSLGTHTLWVAADNTNAFNETNNFSSFTFTVTAPDLIVNSLTPASTSVDQGTSLSFNFGITNQGTGPAGLSEPAWQVDAKPTLTSSAGSILLTSLAAGSTVPVPPFPHTISTAGLSLGTHTLWVAADLFTASETNQFSSFTFTVVLPPAVIQSDFLAITRTALPLDQATTIADSINAGTQTESQYVDTLLSQAANTTIPAVAVEGSMYDAVGSSAEITRLVTQVLPSQIENAAQHGLNPQVSASEALGLAFAFADENGGHTFANNFGPSNAAMPATPAGDAAFAATAASAIFGSIATTNTVNAILGWVNNWVAFYTAHEIPGVANATAAQIDLAARGTAWGDAVGVALANNLGPLPGQVINFLKDAAHGTAIYSAPLTSQPTAAAFAAAAAATAPSTTDHVQLTGVAASVDHLIT